MFIVYRSEMRNKWVVRKARNHDTRPKWWVGGHQWDMSGPCRHYTKKQIQFLFCNIHFEDTWYYVFNENFSLIEVGKPENLTQNIQKFLSELNNAVETNNFSVMKRALSVLLQTINELECKNDDKRTN